MFGPRYSAKICLLLGCAVLDSCAATKPEPSLASRGAPAMPPHEQFSINTPLHIIAANPRGRSVLKHDIPELMANRSYPLFDDMSLSQIASMSGGRFTTAKLNELEADLLQIPEGPGD
jgi:hypothetical protein